MGSKRKTYQKKPFESDCSASDTSANVFSSMLRSPAWKSLSPQQKVLYLCCKSRLYGEHPKPDKEHPERFTIPQHVWADEFELYQKSNAKGFYRDMRALISAGFIACIECGAATRTKSVYELSSAWHRYGTDGFSIPLADMTSAMLRKVTVSEAREDGQKP